MENPKKPNRPPDLAFRLHPGETPEQFSERVYMETQKFVQSRKKPKHEPIDARNAVITMERTVCHGLCPAYKLTIHGDGRVEYEGTYYVETIGTKEFHIPEAKVSELIDAFFAIDYFSLQDDYETDGFSIVTCLPTTFTSITIGSRSKKVRDYFGAPKKLTTLEKQIDHAVDSKSLIGNGGMSSP